MLFDSHLSFILPLSLWLKIVDTREKKCKRGGELNWETGMFVEDDHICCVAQSNWFGGRGNEIESYRCIPRNNKENNNNNNANLKKKNITWFGTSFSVFPLALNQFRRMPFRHTTHTNTLAMVSVLVEASKTRMNNSEKHYIFRVLKPNAVQRLAAAAAAAVSRAKEKMAYKWLIVRRKHSHTTRTPS